MKLLREAGCNRGTQTRARARAIHRSGSEGPISPCSASNPDVRMGKHGKAWGPAGFSIKHLQELT